MDKRTAEQILDLTEAYTLDDLNRASRAAVKKWHPDMAERNGIPPEVAAENYGQIENAKRWLVDFFEGQTADYRLQVSEAPSPSQPASTTTSVPSDTRGRARRTQTSTSGREAPRDEGNPSPTEERNEHPRRRQRTQESPEEAMERRSQAAERARRRRAEARRQREEGVHDDVRGHQDNRDVQEDAWAQQDQGMGGDTPPEMSDKAHETARLIHNAFLVLFCFAFAVCFDMLVNSIARGAGAIDIAVGVAFAALPLATGIAEFKSGFLMRAVDGSLLAYVDALGQEKLWAQAFTIVLRAIISLFSALGRLTAFIVGKLLQ